MRADAVATTRLIRAAALDEFAKQGLRAPLEGIARAAGVSKGTIYNRFGSRDGLIDSVVEEIAAGRLEEVFDAAEREPTPLARLEASLIATWRLQFESPAVNDVLMDTHPTSRVVTEMCERAAHRAGALLADAQASGDVRLDLQPGDTYALTLYVGAAARARIDLGPEVQERLFSVILSGLRTI